MASNEFLQNGSTTTLTLLYDTPKEGQTRFGPYRAYRVATPDGEAHTFFPPRSLYPDLDHMALRRGSQISVRLTDRISDDGRVFPRYEVHPVDGEPVAMPPVLPSPSRSSGGILASVALKAATSSSSLGDPESILSIADRYLAWLQARSTNAV